MNFIDEAKIEVYSGKGGDGCIAFRRERYLPRGGPSGGDGGRGGSVILQADSALGTLLDLQYRKVYKAKNGQPGLGKDKYGVSAEDLVVRIPTGTLIYDTDSGELLADLAEHEAKLVAVRGGQGGRGNIHFKTSTHQAPRKAELGEPSEARNLRLELKLLADVGVVGFPNAGKSTLVSRLSKAKPKVADYPFTTLVPSLGVVAAGDMNSFVMADVPGLIEGAAEGHGLGHRFLKHVERCGLLVHLLSWQLGDEEGHEPLLQRYITLEREMRLFDEGLAEKPRLVALAKTDLPESRELLEPLREAFKQMDIELLSFSAVSNDGLKELVGAIWKMLQESRAKEETPKDDD
ncbi:MAG: GTPase ObgE [Deltaproteobacteria bacterium]|nr:GTPase ObgE [Deltaproteobacteria bacterium]